MNPDDHVRMQITGRVLRLRSRVKSLGEPKDPTTFSALLCDTIPVQNDINDDRHQPIKIAAHHISDFFSQAIMLLVYRAQVYGFSDDIMLSLLLAMPNSWLMKLDVVSSTSSGMYPDMFAIRSELELDGDTVKKIAG